MSEQARTWALRLLALGISIGIWFNASVEDRLVSSEKVVEVGITYNRPRGFMIINPALSKEFGTRHRAALGITEETDAVAVVVSEETGTISVAFNGVLTPDLDSNSLRNSLYRYLVTDLYPKGGRT